MGLPFRLAEQVLVYQPIAPGAPAAMAAQPAALDELEQTRAVIHAMQGRTLVLVTSIAEVQRYRQALADLERVAKLCTKGGSCPHD